MAADAVSAPECSIKYKYLHMDSLSVISYRNQTAIVVIRYAPLKPFYIDTFMNDT